MKRSDIKEAFRPAPASFRLEVNQMIEQLEDKPMKKRYKVTTILAASLIAAILGTAAVAAVQGHIKEMFQNPEQALENHAIEPGIQSINKTYEGKAVRFTMQEALCDAEGGTFALSWEWDNLTDEDGLYVVCDHTLFEGEMGDWRMSSYTSEFFLPREPLVGSLLGTLPDNDATRCELQFTVLRAIGPYKQEADGYILVEDEHYCPDGGDESTLYSDALVASGSFEIADRFVLEFDMDASKLGSTAKRLTGQTDFKFDGYELNVTFGEITATRAHIVVEYISDTEITDGGKGIGPNYDIDFILPGGDIWWTGNSGGVLGDPEQLPDGRWRSMYDFEAVELFTQPDELQMLFSTYPVVDGDVDLSNPILHDDIPMLLRFE